MVSVRLLYYQCGQFFPEDVMDMGRAVVVELFRASGPRMRSKLQSGLVADIVRKRTSTWKYGGRDTLSLTLYTEL
jgi:hypothetical protein